jgi:uncharacterized membrane protein YebE (DUF533 family)
MAKRGRGRGSKKIAGVSKNVVAIAAIVAVAGVGFYVYKKKSQGQAFRARAYRRAMLARQARFR